MKVVRKQIKRMAFCLTAVAAVWLGGVLADSQRLQQDILRLHVVAASDSDADQGVKLQVRDAVLGCLSEGLQGLTDPQAAADYVQQMLPAVEQAARQTLRQAGFSDEVCVSLEREAFEKREYETFSLPAGVYRSLRVVIGEGQGRNWWCVVFPQLCMASGAEEVSALSDTLHDTITGEYEIRFWLLDKLGQVRNFLFSASE